MPLKTVNVPPQVEPIFARAEEVVSEYFGDRTEDPSVGMIKIHKERYVLVRAASLSVEFFALVGRLLGEGKKQEADEFARNLLYDLAHSIGRSDAACFHEAMGLSDPIERLAAGPVLFAYSGWAFVDILPESTPSPDENYYLLYDHPYSFEAESWIEQGAATEFPVCIMNAGYSTGWCEASFGLTLVASEVLCRARGDPHCRFIMAPHERIEEHIARYMQAEPELAPKMRSYHVPDFFARKRLEEELRDSLAEMERFNRLMMDREGRVLELKQEVNDLLAELGKPPVYQTAGLGS